MIIALFFIVIAWFFIIIAWFFAWLLFVFSLLLHRFSWEGCPSARLSNPAEHQKRHFCIIARGREQAMMWPDCRGGRAGRPARLPRQCGQTERVVIIRRKKREEKRREGEKNKKLEMEKESRIHL